NVTTSTSGAIGSRSHSYANNGTYTVTETVTNKDSFAGTGTFQVSVAQVAPANLNLSLSSPAVNETGGVTLSGSFTDTGTLDGHTVDINWGDGAPHTVLPLNPNVLSFSAPHQYLDNLPGNAPYAISVVVKKTTTPDLLVGDYSTLTVRRFSGVD